MTNGGERGRWLTDAEACWRSAERLFEIGDWRVTIQNAQLTVELSAKAVISFFTEPEWTHEPSGQLQKIVEEVGGGKTSYGGDIIGALEELARDVEVAAPWHGWSTYGKKISEEKWIPAVDACDESNARDLLQRARRSIWTAFAFVAESG